MAMPAKSACGQTAGYDDGNVFVDDEKLLPIVVVRLRHTTVLIRYEKAV
jgi:hypothetical protein